MRAQSSGYPNMQSDRRNFLSLLIQSEPGKPAIASGIRAAIGFGMPLVVGQLIDHRASGLFVSLITFFITLTNIDGSYHIKAKTMLAATVGIAISVLVGLLAGNVPILAVCLTFCWGLACGFAPLYGTASDRVGLVIGLSFLFAIGHPSNLETALIQSLLCLLAGGWAMLLALAMWPLQPDRLLRFSVAACFDALADYLQAFGAEVDLTARAVAIRTALETARAYLGTTHQSRQSDPSWLEEQLLVLIQDGERLFGSVITLTELLDNYALQQQERAVRSLLNDALTQISLVLQSIAKVIAGKSASIDFQPLVGVASPLENRIYAAIKEREKLFNHSIERHQVTSTTSIVLGHSLLTIEKLSHQLHYTANSARSVRIGRAVMTDNRYSTNRRDIDRLLLVKDEPRSTLGLLRENLTLDSAIFRHALRLSLSLTIGVIIYSITQLLMGYWVTLTIMLVLKPSLGMTFQRFFQRVGGTLLGALVAAILLATISSKPILDLIIVLTIFFGVALMALNYGSSVVFSSIFILLIADLTDVNDTMGWEFAGFRILNTCIGAGLAFGSHYLLWPNSERERLPSQLAIAIRKSQTYFSDVMAVYQGTKADDATMLQQRRQTGLAIGNAQTSFQGLLCEPRMPKELVEPVMTLLTYIRRFTKALTVLLVHLERVGAIAPLPALATFVSQVSLVLEQLADAVERQTTPPPLPDLEATLASLQAHFQAPIGSSDAGIPIDPTVIDYSILALESDQLVRRLTAMHSAIDRLTSGRRSL
jgi:uncharacterized membrane protein YccC